MRPQMKAARRMARVLLTAGMAVVMAASQGCAGGAAAAGQSQVVTRHIETEAGPIIAPYRPSVTRGDVRVTLLGAGFKTFFEGETKAAAGKHDDLYAVNGFEIEYLVEDLGPEPSQMPAGGGFAVVVGGRVVKPPMFIEPPPYAFTRHRSYKIEYTHHLAGCFPSTDGLEPEKPERAYFVREVTLGLNVNADRADVEIYGGTGEKPQTFLFKDLPLRPTPVTREGAALASGRGSAPSASNR